MKKLIPLCLLPVIAIVLAATYPTPFVTTQTAASSGIAFNGAGASNVNATNIYFNAFTNTFAGPTNSLALGFDAAYTTLGNVGVTNLTGGVASKASFSTLAIFNGSGSNTTLYIASTWLTQDGARSYVLTNGILTQLSVRRAAGYTNATVAPFF